MQKKLLLLSFIEGAAVMAAELCGAKLLAPIFGSSLYVWASVMGITLAALALGYFFGGRLSEGSGTTHKKLFLVLSAAALFLVLLPVLSHYLVPRISYLPFLPGVVISTVVILFLPVFLLGATSPLFIALQTNSTTTAGKVSGTVYAVSTAGGIVATFLCGFWLIPQIGLSACLACFGGLLFVVTIIVFRIFKPFHLFLFVAFAYLNVQFTYMQNHLLLSSDSLLGHLDIEEYHTAKDTIRVLRINNIIQTEMSCRTQRSVSEYVSLLDTLIPEAATQQPALVLGLGGGLTANLLQHKQYTTDGVELDSRIITVARDYFYLDKKVNVLHEDARYYLNGCTKKYALVLADVFRAEEQPSHIITSESLEQLKHNLQPCALLLINWHGYLRGANGLGTAVLYNTLQRAGFHVQLCSTSADENYRNIIFVASLHELPALPFQLQEPVEPTTLVNTDNVPVLEKCNAQANKLWRSNYLRFYQNKGE